MTILAPGAGSMHEAWMAKRDARTRHREFDGGDGELQFLGAPLQIQS